MAFRLCSTGLLFAIGMAITGGGGLFPLNPIAQRDQPTMAFGFGIEIGGGDVGFEGVGGLGGLGGVGGFGVAPCNTITFPEIGFIACMLGGLNGPTRLASAIIVYLPVVPTKLTGDLCIMKLTVIGG